jgi:hypothetical protein
MKKKINISNCSGNHLTRRTGIRRAGISIADNLSMGGLSLGWVSAVDPEGRTIWIVDAHRGDGKRFVVRADEKLTAFFELEAPSRAGGAILLDEQ